jgi:hypothetical protein
MFSLIVPFALLGRHLVSAAPAKETSASKALAKRDVCDGVNATPVLYTEYHDDSCPPRNVLNADGSCPGQDYYQNECYSFCQIRTTFSYRTEIPIANTYCHGPFTCTVTDTVTKTVTKSANVNLKFVEAYGLGISGGFSYADAEARARAYSVKLDEGNCGYFTIVPVWKEVW